MASRANSGRNRPSLQRRYITLGGVAAVVLFAALALLTSLNLVLAWVAAWTVPTFLLYGFDKMRAKRDGLRVPEISLLVMSVSGGFLGALTGMAVFHHKTTRRRFWAAGIVGAALFSLLYLSTVL